MARIRFPMDPRSTRAAAMNARTASPPDGASDAVGGTADATDALAALDVRDAPAGAPVDLPVDMHLGPDVDALDAWDDEHGGRAESSPSGGDWPRAALGGAAALGLLLAAGGGGGGGAARGIAIGGDTDHGQALTPTVPVSTAGGGTQPGTNGGQDRPHGGADDATGGANANAGGNGNGNGSDTGSGSGPGSGSNSGDSASSVDGTGHPGHPGKPAPSSEPDSGRPGDPDASIVGSPRVALRAAVIAPDDGRLSTRDATVIVGGIAPNASWWYSLDDGVTWIRGRGDRIPGHVFGDDGLKHLQVRQVDAAGTPSDSAALSFTLDTTAPASPTVRLTHDTGIAGDQVTHDWSFSIGGLEPGAQWRFSVDGEDWRDGAGHRFDAVDAQGRPLVLPDGAHTVRVEVRDAVGNTAQGALVFTTDVTPPLDPLTVALENDSGSDDTDGITNDPALAIVGLQPGDRWAVSVDHGATWRSTLPGESAPDFFSQLLNTDGAWEVLVRREDAAGNAGPVGAAFAFTLDRTGPATPATVRLLNDTGDDKTDGITADASIQVTMTGDAVRTGYRLSAADSWTNIGADGLLADALFPRSDQARTVEVAQWDVAGNRGESAWLSFTKPLVLDAPHLELPAAATPQQGVGLPV